MPLLRQALHGFVRMWNVHTIQAQRHRPNAVTGQLWKLYHLPSDALQCGITPESEFLQALQEDVVEWGMLYEYPVHY